MGKTVFDKIHLIIKEHQSNPYKLEEDILQNFGRELAAEILLLNNEYQFLAWNTVSESVRGLNVEDGPTHNEILKSIARGANDFILSGDTDMDKKAEQREVLIKGITGYYMFMAESGKS